jgi:hypothetical protein
MTLYTDSRWRRVVSFMPRPPYSLLESPRRPTSADLSMQRTKSRSPAVVGTEFFRHSVGNMPTQL